MAECAMLIAMLLHRPVGLVTSVYDVAGLSGVCVVEYESQFCVTACRREEKGGTSWGLWQLWSVCHPQYRDDLLMHLVYGAEFWKACLQRAGGSKARSCPAAEGNTAQYRSPSALSIAVGYSIYNSGSTWRSIEKGLAIQRRYDSLAMYLWRRMR